MGSGADDAMSHTRRPCGPQTTGAPKRTITAARFTGTSAAPAAGSSNIAPATARTGDPTPEAGIRVRSVSGAHAPTVVTSGQHNTKPLRMRALSDTDRVGCWGQRPLGSAARRRTGRWLAW